MTDMVCERCRARFDGDDLQGFRDHKCPPATPMTGGYKVKEQKW